MWTHFLPFQISRSLRGRTEHAVKSRVATLARLKVKDWTPEEDALLNKLKGEGLDFDAISTHFTSRSIHSIKKRWERLYMNTLAEKVRAKQPEPDTNPAPYSGRTSQDPASVAPPLPTTTTSTMPLGLSPPPPVKRSVSRLARHSTSMTVLLQVLGDPLPDSSGHLLSSANNAAYTNSPVSNRPMFPTPIFLQPQQNAVQNMSVFVSNQNMYSSWDSSSYPSFGGTTVASTTPPVAFSDNFQSRRLFFLTVLQKYFLT